MEEPVQNHFQLLPGAVPRLQRAGPIHSRATVRASLACLSCRSKHVKCDGYIPSCTRCRLDEKTCCYTKSRRGIRDPRRRSLKSDAPANELVHSASPPSFTSFQIPIKLNHPFPGGWTASSKLRPAQPLEYLIDLYYACFHDCHPWLPPKETMHFLIQARPEEMNCVLMMILYVGSIYTTTVDTAPLRQTAYALASGSLGKTVWDVQALLSLSVAACGENYLDHCGLFFDKALQIALELGLQDKNFADAEPNPILAESYRRTYWAVYFHGSVRTVRENRGHFLLYTTGVTTDLPCEEWEYQTGKIPTPVSLREYEEKGASREYSSWAYLIGLVRISGAYVVPVLNTGFGVNQDAIDRADHQVASWLLQLPQWKKELVDPDGAVDLILYTAIGIAHGLRIRINLHLNGVGVRFGINDLLRQGPILHRSSPLPPNVGSKARPWVHGSMALHKSLELVGLFKACIPPEKSSPSCTLGMERAVLPMLDSYIYGKCRSAVLREKIMLLANVLGRVGDFWPNARKVSGDIIRAVEVADSSWSMQLSECHDWEPTMDQTMPSVVEDDDLFQLAPFMPEQAGTSAGGMTEGVRLEGFNEHLRIEFHEQQV